MVWGIGELNAFGFSGPNNYDMKGLNAGWCARFMALSAADIKSVRLYWSSVTIGTGTMTLRIETIDATTGKPTGTLYDSHAVIASIVPAAGIQTYTFGTLPIAGMVAGTEYALVLLTTAAFTACLLSSQQTAALPACVLTAADGTTRSNFAEVSNAFPVVSFVLEDDSSDSLNCWPFATYTSVGIYATTAQAAKITLSQAIKVAGISAYMTKTGTPAGDLRVRVMDSANNVIANTTITVDKDSNTQSTNFRRFYFPAIATLPPGVYRIVFDAAGSASSSNCVQLRTGTPFAAALTAAMAWIWSTTADVTANPIVWSDDATGVIPSAQFMLDDVPNPPPTFKGVSL